MISFDLCWIPREAASADKGASEHCRGTISQSQQVNRNYCSRGKSSKGHEYVADFACFVLGISIVGLLL